LKESGSAKIWKEIPFIPKSKLFSSYYNNHNGNIIERKEDNENFHLEDVQIKENNKNNVMINKLNYFRQIPKKIKHIRQKILIINLA
jgi:hypothetical protein